MINLHLGDCLDFMRTLESGSVDAVITDPPYGVRDDDWDNMDAHEFARFTMAWMAEAKRIAKELIVFCPDNAPIKTIQTVAEMLYPRVRRMIWHKPLGSQYAGSSERKLWFGYETILHCHNQETWSVVKPKLLAVGSIIQQARIQKKLSRGAVDMVVRGKKTGLCYRWEEGACLPTPEQTLQLKELLGLNGDLDVALEIAYADKDDTLGAARQIASHNAAEKSDVFSYPPPSNGLHPCEKPIPLLCSLLMTVGIDYKTVLDPFMGSGTMGIACAKLSREFFGSESDADYFKLAKRRIETAQMQMPLDMAFEKA